MNTRIELSHDKIKFTSHDLIKINEYVKLEDETYKVDTRYMTKNGYEYSAHKVKMKQLELPI